VKNKLILLSKILGAFLSIILLWFIIAINWTMTLPESNIRAEKTLIKNVSIIDVEKGVTIPNQDILIENGEIKEIGENLTQSHAQIVKADGKFAIPGLFDMHAHSLKSAPYLAHPLFIANGVTALRDMGGCLDDNDPFIACAKDKRNWNNAIKVGTMIAPRYDQLTSLAINGDKEIPAQFDTTLGATTPNGAQERVKYDKTRGIDFLKTYTMLSREGYFALAKAANENSMYLAGHLPLAVSGLEAIEAGQRSFEHAFLFITECFPEMKNLRNLSDPREIYTNTLRLKMIGDHDKQLCSTLHKKMVASGVAFVPTHTTRKLDAFAINETFRNDPRLKYIPSPLRFGWLQDANNMAARAEGGDQTSYMDFYEFGIMQTGIAHKAGVTILAGTDAPDSFVFPGFSLHDELDHFIKAGLSPLEALRTATLDPAKFLGLEGKAGVIKIGARADLVFLNANPLENIKATRDIDTVILAGTVYSRDDLDYLLQAVEGKASGWTMWPKFLWQTLTSPIMRIQFAD
jgi:imidazolonepropionase-like amidohydrolase